MVDTLLPYTSSSIINNKIVIHHSIPQKKINIPKFRRTKTGCPQCRKRKIKCDESLPGCYKCARKGLKCGYIDYTEEQVEGLEKIQEARRKSETGENSCTKINRLQKIESIEIRYFESSSFNIPLIRYSYNPFNLTNYQIILQMALFSQISNDSNNIGYNSSYNSQSLSLFVPSLFTDIRTFDASLLLTYSLMISKHSELLPFFLKIQSNCINHILNSLKNLDDSSVIQTLIVSISLDISSYNLSLNSLNISNGPKSILKTVFQDRNRFPKSSKILEQYASILL